MTLTELFGIPKLVFTVQEGRMALRAFAEKYPSETIVRDEGSEVVFETKSKLFAVRTFLVAGSTVYTGTIFDTVEEDMETILYRTGHKTTLDEVLVGLITGARQF